MSRRKIAAPAGGAAEAALTSMGVGAALPATALVAGVDEAGRGPLAGPVVAAAVVLDPANPIDGLTDSKLLSARARTELAREIRRNALAFGLGLADPAEIDTINILQASLRAMERAVVRLELVPELVLVDGNRLPLFVLHGQRLRAHAIVDGDLTEPCISAASILAKVCRDRLMRRWHRRFPEYGFDRNKGYATAEHMARLKRLGPCAIHRTSFAPVHDRQGQLFA